MTNGADLKTTSYPSVGFLYTAAAPSTRPSRFGHGAQVGVHAYFDNNTRASEYTLDATFYDVYAQLTNGSFAFRV